ncbi:arylsulfatase A family protein [Halogeometricum pallidum JCM 14848]|uniref:Arylsulfatase A family protein n=1 Tax=Halogeometricum pallidum JCM 14848 TaxID=1227487 RepID=M0DAG7_HALPD|nr:sulfatase [Halogeometricum pallidum]ELZ31798.1 arylsulfatase A family protein [Halogeometricum pallidum JCM 14848]
MSRDIVWITLESVRQDHTSLGGYHRDTTPFLRSLADRGDGAAFTNCFSHDIWTRASSASILTGLSSSAHRTWSQEARLSGDVPTVPEALRRAGYRTVCVSPNPQLSEATGLARGFDRFQYLGKSTLLEEAGVPTVLRYLTKLNSHSAGYTTDTAKHSIGYLSDAIARRRIREAARDDEDLFLYVHLGDSHHPYYPPKPYQDLYADGFEMSVEEALAFAMEMSDDLHGYIARGAPFAEDEWDALYAMYDASIRYVDEILGRIVECASEELDDPIVVVTSDHGELFGEKGMLAHMVVADDAVSHVPLVVAGVDGLAGTRDELVQHADAMKTVLAEAGVDADVPAGIDLREEEREFAVTQRGGRRHAHKMDIIGERDASFDPSRYHAGDLTSLRTDDYRYQRGDDGEELFALPDEVIDVAAERPDARAELAEKYEAWMNAYGLPRSEREERAEFDESMASHLEDLGYL